MQEIHVYRCSCSGCQQELILFGRYLFEALAQVESRDWYRIERWDGDYYYCPECRMEKVL